MAIKYPPIPAPRASTSGLYSTVVALYEAVQMLTGARRQGGQLATALTTQDLASPIALRVPGPFLNDTLAGEGGVAVGQVYYRLTDNLLVVRAP